jgi:Na+/H+ antiporter NhaC
MWIFQGFVDVIVYITIGGFFVGFIRYIVPALIKGTSSIDHMMTYGWPALIFFGVIMMCALAFKKRRNQGRQ